MNWKFLPLLTLIFLISCANPGPPKPPSLHLPRPAGKFSAERTGDLVNLTWTTAPDTTDDGGLHGPTTAVVCRDDAPKPPPAAPQYPVPANPCRTILRLTVVPGSSQAVDRLTGALVAGPPALIGYRVELQNDRGRSAGPSAPAYAAAGAAPAPAGAISIALRRNAALITWQTRTPPENSTPAPMQVQRTLLATSAGPVAPSRPKAKSPKPVAASGDRETLKQATLYVDTAPDPGGTLDRSLHDGDTLTYTAQRIRSAAFTLPDATYTTRDGKQRQAKSTVVTLEIHGEPSAPVPFTFHDTIPPSPPTGLAAVPGGGFSEPPSIDLSWEPNPEFDILGYGIERADAGSGSRFTRINPEPVPGFSYRDLSAQPGHPYIYRITAIDRRHNESQPSQTVAAGLHP